MIVGSGLLARAFERYAGSPDVLVFASGVSNSGERDPAAFDRERDLLAEARTRHPLARVVYFGSCGVAGSDEPETPYIAHKRAMEADVVRRGGLVLRLPQVVGVTPNPNTLTNYLRDRILSGEPFTVWSLAERNLMDIDDIVSIGSALIDAPQADLPPAVAIAAAHPVSMPALVALFERVLDREARYTLVERGAPFPIDARVAGTIAERLGIDLGPASTERILRKYYGHHAEA